MPDTIIGPVPDAWQATTLGELCKSGDGDIQTGPFGSQLHASDYVPAGIPSVMPQNIGDNCIVEDGIARITEEDASRLSRYLLREGDIVYSRRGDVERRAWVRAEQDGWLCGTGCLRVRLGVSTDARFISYYLGHPNVRAWIVQHAIGATMANLNTAILGSVPVAIPSRPEQASIAEVLGALDDKIAVNDRIAETALQLALGEYAGWMNLGWLQRSELMADCGRWFSGGTPDTSEDYYWGGDIPWISASSLKSPWIDSSDRMITRIGAVNGTRLVPRGAVIFVVRGMSLVSEFRIGLTQREVAFGQDCKAILPIAGIDAATLFISIKSRTPDILRLVDNAGHGTGRLPTDLLSNMKLNLPAAEFSEVVAAALRSLVAVGAERQAENRSLSELRDTLLPKLMSGEIRVRDAEKVVEDVT
jgi:type I restriction enzyme, S subunit